MDLGTACAEMAQRLLGVGEGDEVIVPAYTYTASASVVNHVGATIVFVDVQKDCLEMDYEALEKVILFNLSGHGLIDMTAYDQYLSGSLYNYELTDEDVQKNLDSIEKYV